MFFVGSNEIFILKNLLLNAAPEAFKMCKFVCMYVNFEFKTHCILINSDEKLKDS